MIYLPKAEGECKRMGEHTGFSYMSLKIFLKVRYVYICVHPSRNSVLQIAKNNNNMQIPLPVVVAQRFNVILFPTFFVLDWQHCVLQLQKGLLIARLSFTYMSAQPDLEWISA